MPLHRRSKQSMPLMTGIKAFQASLRPANPLQKSEQTQFHVGLNLQKPSRSKSANGRVPQTWVSAPCSLAPSAGSFVQCRDMFVAWLLSSSPSFVRWGSEPLQPFQKKRTCGEFPWGIHDGMVFPFPNTATPSLICIEFAPIARES